MKLSQLLDVIPTTHDFIIKTIDPYVILFSGCKEYYPVPRNLLDADVVVVVVDALGILNIVI